MPSIKNYEILFALVLNYSEGKSVSGGNLFIEVNSGQLEKFQRIHLSDLDSS